MYPYGDSGRQRVKVPLRVFPSEFRNVMQLDLVFRWKLWRWAIRGERIWTMR